MLAVDDVLRVKRGDARALLARIKHALPDFNFPAWGPSPSRVEILAFVCAHLETINAAVEAPTLLRGFVLHPGPREEDRVAAFSRDADAITRDGSVTAEVVLGFDALRARVAELEAEARWDASWPTEATTMPLRLSLDGRATPSASTFKIRAETVEIMDKAGCVRVLLGTRGEIKRVPASPGVRMRLVTNVGARAILDDDEESEHVQNAVKWRVREAAPFQSADGALGEFIPALRNFVRAVAVVREAERGRARETRYRELTRDEVSYSTQLSLLKPTHSMWQTFQARLRDTKKALRDFEGETAEWRTRHGWREGVHERRSRRVRRERRSTWADIVGRCEEQTDADAAVHFLSLAGLGTRDDAPNGLREREKVIAACYRKLALEYHPDKRRGDDAMFKRILMGKVALLAVVDV